MRLTVLGTGTSFGVPQVGCRCAVCRSADPRDRRTRTAAVIQTGGATLLIDTPCEIRQQLVAAGVDRVDAVLYTHEHADHVGGIDDLRIFSIRRRTPLPCYGPHPTVAYLRSAYRYIFDDGVAVPDGTSKPRLDLQALESGVVAAVAGVDVLPIAFDHGYSSVFGYRIGDVAYVTDVKAVPTPARHRLAGVRVLVLSALWWREHPTHQSIPDAIEVARAIGAERTYLTHLSHETSHADLLARLPAGIEPAHDGLTVEV
jgi:phosphoribosyl 1,2-cyclic phosphate phosphodiesterase